MSKPDTDKWLKNDVETISSEVSDLRNGEMGINPIDALEAFFWAIAVFSAVAMLGSMAWVGSDSLISGEAWIGLSVIGISLGAVGGGAVRYLKQFAGNGGQRVARKSKGGR